MNGPALDLHESSRIFLRKLYFKLHWLLGDGNRLLNNIHKNNWVISLNLHRVSTEVNPFYPPLHPKLFEELLAFLKENFAITTYGGVATVTRGRTPLVLSFDDGYHDFLEYAVPALEGFGVTANQNVVCQCLVSGKPIWNVQLYDFLNQAPTTLLNELRIVGWTGKFGKSDTERSRAGTAISRLLKNLPRRERLEQWKAIEGLMNRCDSLRFTRVLSSTEVVGLSAKYSIGVHSFEHDSMGLESEDFFARDFLRCREYFEDHLKLPLDTYAFPNGNYRPEQVKFLLRSGIQSVLLVDEQLGQLGAQIQPRLTFYGDSSAELRLRSLGYFAKGARCES